MKKQIRKEKLNGEIKIQNIRLTGDGFKGEVVTLKEALALANDLELDLVLVTETNDIGVCKIMNYEKYMYEQSKKPKNKGLDVKEVKLGPNMADNDLDYRTKHIIEFLQKGHKVKLTMQFRGREMAFVDKGQELMLKLILNLEDHGSAESIPKLEGKKLISTLKPKPKK
jgi:translation initiation factor IF-3